jgi:uncharacterized tellurite resistance protein B-like protein
MLEALVSKLREAVERIAPSAEAIAQRESLALRAACCSLLVEVARIDRTGAAAKREAIARAMRETLDIANGNLASLIAETSRDENRLTSYHDAVTLINGHLSAAERVAFVERLWRVAAADGRIDMYEEDLVRQLADLLYVGHADFILAKHRVRC